MARPRPQKGSKTAADMFSDEEKRVSKPYSPMRFFVPKGESTQVIVLDENLESGLAIREYEIQGSDGKWGNYERSFEDLGIECPIGKKYGATSYVVLFLTVIVMKEWVSKKTGETHSYSKMLLPIKRGLYPKIQKLEKIALKNNGGTMRGASFWMEREDKDQSLRTGEPAPDDDGQLLEYWSEDDLIDNFGHQEIKSRDGRVLKKKNEDLMPYDYLKLFPEPTIEEARSRHGLDPEPGSLEDNAQSFEEEEEEADDPIDMGPSLIPVGKAADDGDGDSIDQLTDLAEQNGLDVNDEDLYPDWSTLAQAITEAQSEPAEEEPKPRRRATKQAKRPSRRQSRKDESQDDGIDEEW